MVKNNAKPQNKYYLLLWINYFFILLLLSANLSPFISPDVFWPISVLGLVMPAIILMNIFFLLLWIVLFRRYYFYSLIALMLSYSLILDHVQFNSSEPSTQEVLDNSVTILSYNVCNLSHNNTRISDKELRQKILEYTNGLKSDIICFQEFQTYPTYPINTVDIYKKGLGKKYVHSAPYLKKNIHKFLDLIVLYSKYSIVNAKDFYMDGKSYGFYVDMKIQNQIFRVFNLHLESNHLGKEDYQIFTEKDASFDDEKRNRIFGLLEKLKKYSLKRSKQVRIIKKEILRSPYPTLVAGDFNDTPASYTVQYVARGLTDAFREKGSGYSNTYNGNLPPMRIDYLLFDAKLKVNSYEVLEADLSDHFPILVNFSLNK